MDEQKLIDANWLKEEIFKLPYNEECLTQTSLDVLALIDKAPTASPKETPVCIHTHIHCPKCNALNEYPEFNKTCNYCGAKLKEANDGKDNK